MIYVLMILSPVLGWHIANIEGNPFPTFKACTEIRNVLVRMPKKYIDGVHFSKARCVPLKKGSLNK